MIHLNKLVTLDVMFSCDKCSVWVVRKIRLKTDMRLDIADFPDGWVLSAQSDYFRTYCPLHANEKGK